MSRRYPSRPIVGVGVVVWHDDRVLLIRRNKPPRQGHWSLPGGAQQLGEIIATIDSIEHDGDRRVRYHYTLIDFVAEAASPVLRPGSDAADARWFEVAEIETLGLWSETVRVIKLAGERRSRR